MYKYSLFVATIIILLCTSCDDSIVIGEDLLGNEEIGTNSRDDFELSAYTSLGRKLMLKTRDLNRRNYLSGEIVDPIFGKYSSDIYVSFGYAAGFPDFFNSTLDSIVLVLQYDTTARYGDTLATHNLSVFRVEEDYASMDSIDVEQSFMRGALLGMKSFVPNVRDSVKVIDRSNPDTTITVPPQLRIKLNEPDGILLGEMLLADSMSALSDTILLDYLKGLYIESRSGGQSMLSFAMGSGSFSSMLMYFTKNDTLKQTFSYLMNNEIFTHIEHDYTGTPVEPFINDVTKGDSLLYVHGLRGLDCEFTLPDLSDLSNTLINKAILTVTVAELPGDFPKDIYPPEDQLVAYTINEDSERVYIDDLAKFGDPNSLQNLLTAITLLDGRAKKVEGDNGEALTQYEVNITDYIINVISKGETDAKLILAPFFREETARNAVLYGPNHSKYPAKLRIRYTEL